MVEFCRETLLGGGINGFLHACAHSTGGFSAGFSFVRSSRVVAQEQGPRVTEEDTSLFHQSEIPLSTAQDQLLAVYDFRGTLAVQECHEAGKLSKRKAKPSLAPKEEYL